MMRERNRKIRKIGIAAAVFLLMLLPGVRADAAAERLDEALYTITFPESGSGYLVTEWDETAGESLEVTDGKILALGGDSVQFSVTLEEGYADASDLHVYADGKELKKEGEYYSIEDVEGDMSVEVAGVAASKEALSYCTVSTEAPEHFSVQADSQCIGGGYLSFTVGVDEAYSNSSYTVTANGETLAADAEGIYTVKITQDTVIKVDGTAELSQCEMTYVFDEDSFGVTLDGQALENGSAVINTGTAQSLVVTGKDGVESCYVVLNGETLTGTEGSDGSLTYGIEAAAEDSTVYISGKVYSVYIDVQTLSEIGTTWNLSYPEGESIVSGASFEFQIRLADGYKNSPVDVYLVTVGDEGRGPGTNPTPVSVSDGVYTYQVTVSDGANYYLYVASSGAHLTNVPMVADTCQVRYFDGDGEDAEILETKELDYGSVLTERSAPEKDGYVFAGWYTSAGKKYDFTQSLKGNRNLFAHWKTAKSVTFVPGMSLNTVTKQVGVGDTVTAPVVSASGYRLVGWYTEEARENLYDFSMPVTEDLTLYAGWEEIPESQQTQSTAVDLSSCTVDAIAAQTFTGAALCPAVRVTRDGSVLSEGVDYTVSYSDNVQVGTAAVTVTGTGSYSGSRTVHFLINPKPTKLKSARSTAKKQVTLKWKKVSGAAGYKIYRSTKKNGKYKQIAALKNVTKKYVDKKVKSKKKYYYKITVIMQNGKYYESTMSPARKVKVK